MSSNQTLKLGMFSIFFWNLEEKKMGKNLKIKNCSDEEIWQKSNIVRIVYSKRKIHLSSNETLKNCTFFAFLEQNWNRQ